MDVSDRIKKLKERMKLNSKMKALVASGILLFSSPSFSQSTDNYNDKNPVKTEQTDNKQAETDNKQAETDNKQAETEYYFRYINVNSLDEMHKSKVNPAEYNQLLDAIIITQYKMENASKKEQKIIDEKNKEIISDGTIDHETFHAGLHKSGITKQLEDGSCITLPHHRIALHILEEALALQKEQKILSIVDAIAKFKEIGREKYYALYYQQDNSHQSLTIPAAMMMDEIVPDSVTKRFNAVGGSGSMKTDEIDGKKYDAWLYVSHDYKHCIWKYVTKDGNEINDPQLEAKSNISAGKVERYERSKNVETYDNSFILTIPNMDKEVNGYSADKLDANFMKVAKQMLEFAGITNNKHQEYAFNYLGEITESYDLTRHDKDKWTVAEIRETYKDKSVDDVIRDAQDKYAEGQKHLIEKEESNVMPYLQKAPNLNNRKDKTLFISPEVFPVYKDSGTSR